MRVLNLILLGLFVSLLVAPVSIAQQSSGTVIVFSDQNANSIFDSGDVELPDWNVSIYGDSFGLLATAAASTISILPDGAAHICLTPEASALQTAPSSGSSNPLGVSWPCLETNVEAESYEFGIYEFEDQENGEVEEGGEVIDRFQNKPTPEPQPDESGQVLGTQDILAETGSEIIIPLLVATIAIGIAITTSKTSKNL